MKRFFTFFLIAFVFVGTSSFISDKTVKPTDDKIEWLTLEEAFASNQKEPRKILIDVYTGWCGWCKVMDKKTFTNPAVIQYVNKTYYAVKLNAESKEPITIGDTKYEFDASNRSHEAAVALLQGKMSYPTIVYLDESFNMIQPISGYMEAPEFHQVITFLGGNYYKKQQFDQYAASTYKEIFKGVE
jgi:thioredoxin-related protein